MAEQQTSAAVSSSENESSMGGPRFSPPLYSQRYDAVIALCRKLRAKKVLQ